MRMSIRIRVLILLLSPVIVEESRLLALRSCARWESPRFIDHNFSRRAEGIGADGSAWSVRRGGGSGGSNTDLTVIDSSGKKLECWSNSESGYPEILVSNSAGKTRFLSYQYYWIGSNHIIHENPLNDPLRNLARGTWSGGLSPQANCP